MFATIYKRLDYFVPLRESRLSDFFYDHSISVALARLERHSGKF